MCKWRYDKCYRYSVKQVNSRNISNVQMVTETLCKMPEIFRQKLKCLVSQIACNIYVHVYIFYIAFTSLKSLLLCFPSGISSPLSGPSSSISDLSPFQPLLKHFLSHPFSAPPLPTPASHFPSPLRPLQPLLYPPSFYCSMNYISHFCPLFIF